MKNFTKYLYKIMLLSALSICMFSSCRDELIITSSENESIIEASSPIAELISNVTENDGSNDNVIDKANCFNIKFPYSVEIGGTSFFINSDSDLNNVKVFLNASSATVVAIIFPVTLILADHSEVMVDNQSTFDNYVNTCNGENVDDDDIECLDFLYPFGINVYNTITESTEMLIINSDTQLFNFVENLTNDDVATINFPVTLILSDNSQVTVNTTDELEAQIETVMNDCDEDDDYDFNDDDDDENSNNICDTPVDIIAPFNFDGSGENCWVTSDEIAYVNSWNVDLLEINGVNLTNQWSDSSFNNFPDKIDGNYYIHYISSVAWGHFETDTQLPNNNGTLCDTPTSINVPYSFDSTGDYCWVTSDDMLYFNSWELDLLEINGIDFTNGWSDTSFNNFPDKIDGNYYIRYVSTNVLGHFEAGTTLPPQNNPLECTDCSTEQVIDAFTSCNDFNVNKFTYYNANLKSKYDGYDFTFNSNNTISIRKNSSAFNGTWIVSKVNSKTYVTILIPLLPDFNGSWEVKRIYAEDEDDTEIKIHLEFGNNILRFKGDCNN